MVPPRWAVALAGLVLGAALCELTQVTRRVAALSDRDAVLIVAEAPPPQLGGGGGAPGAAAAAGGTLSLLAPTPSLRSADSAGSEASTQTQVQLATRPHNSDSAGSDGLAQHVAARRDTGGYTCKGAALIGADPFTNDTFDRARWSEVWARAAERAEADVAARPSSSSPSSSSTSSSPSSSSRAAEAALRARWRDSRATASSHSSRDEVRLLFQNRPLIPTSANATFVSLLAHTGARCTRWSVTATSAVSATEAVRLQANLGDEWCLVIVGGAQAYELPDGSRSHVVFLNSTRQSSLRAAGVELLEALAGLGAPSSLGDKNVGYLFAIANGAELVWDFDEDYALLDKRARTVAVACSSAARWTEVARLQPRYTACGSLNPYALMGFRGAPRGMPRLDERCAQALPAHAYVIERVATQRLGVCHSLARGEAPAGAARGDGALGALPLVVPRSAMVPWSARATMFSRDALWSLPLLATLPGAVAEVWRSYVAQRLLREVGLEVLVTAPVVEQTRGGNTTGRAESVDSDPSGAASEALVGFLLRWRWLGAWDAEPPARMEQLYSELYERGFVARRDVLLVQAWLLSLIRAGYRFPATVDARGAAECRGPGAATPGLQLFLPTLDRAANREYNILTPTLGFFWPRDQLDFLIVLDEELQERAVREGPVSGARLQHARRLLDAYPRDAKRVALAYASGFANATLGRHEKGRFGKGHDTQQLYMLWADNFTEEEYVGFIDTDTLFTSDVRGTALFDEQGRAHAVVTYNEGFEAGVWDTVATTTCRLLGLPVEVFKGMDVFPFVFKTAHLALLRARMLQVQPSFACFDDLAVELVKLKFSQFNLMASFAWNFLRDQYSWKVMLRGPMPPVRNARDVSRFPSASITAYGITAPMLEPFARVAIHGKYSTRIDPMDASTWFKNPPGLLRDAMRLGYCYSQPPNEPDEACCAALDLDATPNTEFQWAFEDLSWAWHPRLREAARAWREDNCARKWDPSLLELVFG